MGYRAQGTGHGEHADMGEAQAGIQGHRFQGTDMGHRAHFRVEENCLHTQPQIMQGAASENMTRALSSFSMWYTLPLAPPT